MSTSEKKQYGAFPVLFQMDDRLVTVEAFVNAKAGILEDVRRFHHDNRIVFDDDGVRDC